MAYDYINFSCQLSSTYNSPGLYATLTDCENAVNDGSVRPVLILNPLWTANKRVSLPLTISALGDGYKQTVFQGLTENEEWDITSPLLTGTEVSQLLNQLQRLSADSFLWSPNNGVVEWREYTCDEWQKIRIGVNQYQITTKFVMTILGSGLIISDTPVNPLDPFAANVVLFLKGNGTNGSTSIIDSSPNPKTITVNGNAQISTAQSKYNGSSILLNADGDFLTLPATNSGDFLFGTRNFTIEAWIYPISKISNFSTIIGNFTTYENNAWSIIWEDAENLNRPSFIVRNNGDVPRFLPLITTTPTYGSWRHIAVCRNGNVFRFFIDGILQGSVTSSISVNSSKDTILIGRVDPPTQFRGYLSHARITMDVGRYTANFNPETDTYLNL